MSLYLSFFILYQGVIRAQPSEEESLARAYGDEDFISLATGSRQLISLAPAVATVITAEDIKAIGATDLDHVLETVPGLHVSNSPRAYGPLYTIRGIYTENNPQVLLLLNDIPITNVYVGDRSQVWGGMPINNIARIEIIRGPGSALYGADAFAGTINIITKTAQDISGTEFGVRAGSYNTREGWILHGGTWNGFDIALSLEALKTDGQDGVIDADAQTGYDTFGTSASLAPGSVNLQRDALDARVDISRDNWRFRAGYQGRFDVGTGAGVAQALDPDGTNDSRRINADLTHDTQWGPNWAVTSQLSFFDTSAESDLVLYPPGASFGGPFPDGMIGSPYVYERHTRLGVSAFYHGIKDHNIRIGAGAIHNDLYKTKERKNFAFAPDGTPIPLGSVVDVSNDPNSVFIEPHDRRISYAFIQDEWSIAPDWVFTGGVRHDHYSDFGNTTNPRLALVWQTRYDLTTKLLYGRAFRAPAFNELYNINNPVALGNPDLDPEKIDTVELAFDHQYSDDLNIKLNVFSYRMSDILRIPPNTSTTQNTGEIHGRGFEIETVYNPAPSLRVLGNYSLQRSIEDDSDNDVANAPRHQAYLRTEWKLTTAWKFNAQANWVADRERDATDSRQNIDDYTTIDVNLRYQPLMSRWELAIAARNLFDADVREPSPRLFPNGIPVIAGLAMTPNDLPLAERNVFAEAIYRFD